MQIYFDQENEVSEDLLDTMKKAASLCVEKEGLDESCCEVSVSFVSGDEIHRLNLEYRGVDRVTDVLSFPQYESPEDIEETISMIGTCEIGDVVICRDRAAQQADRVGFRGGHQIGKAIGEQVQFAAQRAGALPAGHARGAGVAAQRKRGRGDH